MFWYLKALDMWLYAITENALHLLVSVRTHFSLLSSAQVGIPMPGGVLSKLCFNADGVWQVLALKCASI